MTSVFIVAAVPAVRAGLRAMLDQGGIGVAGEASAVPGEPSATILLIAGDFSPDDVPENAAVVLLSNDARQASVLRNLALSGWALLPPDSAAGQLVAAVNAVAEGLVVLPVDTALALGSVAPVEVSDALQEPLTPRELEVLQLVSHGLSNKLIARALTISEHTVKFHVSATYAKLGAASRTEAVSLAARKGLISL